jgi:hypothetical protein
MSGRSGNATVRGVADGDGDALAVALAALEALGATPPLSTCDPHAISRQTIARSTAGRVTSPP